MDQGRQNPLVDENQKDKPMNRKVTNQITIQENSEINKISLENLPKNLQQKIYLFKALHYFLLIIAIISIIVKRVTEYDDIQFIESKEKQEDKKIYYLLSGLIYVKYNCEILNFVIFKVFIKQLQEKNKNTFILKMVIEALMIILYLCKLTLYLIELQYSKRLFQGLTYLNILLEIFLMCIHVFIIILFVRMRKKIFLVYYLKEKLQVKNKQFNSLIMGQVCQAEKRIKQINFSNTNLHLECSMWHIDQNGLYNLKAEKSELKTQHFKINKENFITLNVNNSLLYFNTKLFEEDTTNKDPLLNLYQDNKANTLMLRIENQELKHNKMLWQNTNQNGKQIRQNDIIKFGKQLFQVNQINFQNHRASFQIKIPENFYNQAQDIDIKNFQRSQNLQCRICLEPEQQDNPFEGKLCPCSKTMPAHLKCLKAWISQKCIQKINDYIVYYDFNNIVCDICKQKYPKNMYQNLNDSQFFNFLFDKFKNFLQLYKICQESNNIIGTFIINLDDENRRIKIGRHTDNDIVQNDIQISRFQAQIRIKNKKLFLIDLDSKFGSYISFNQDIDLFHYQNSYIYIDKYRLKFHILKKNQKCKCEKLKKIHYTKQIQKPINKVLNQNKNILNISIKQEQNLSESKNETESESESEQENKIMFTQLSTPAYEEYDKENFVFDNQIIKKLLINQMFQSFQYQFFSSLYFYTQFAKKISFFNIVYISMIIFFQ